jgi:RNA polymerase sigma-70 factor (ECF subfamily)
MTPPDLRRSATGAEEADLIARIKAGNEEAWGEVYDHLHRPLLGYLYGKGAQDPEDLLAEVFLRLARSIGGFSGDLQGLRALSFTIAQNCLRDAARRRAVRPDTVFLAPEHVELGGGASGSAEDEAMATVNLETYRAGFAALTEDQRQVLYLRIVADLSIEETAELTGKSPGAVKQLHRRALGTVRESIEQTAAGTDEGGEGL